MEKSEKQVLASLKNGDDWAYEYVFRTYFARLSVFSMKYVGDLEHSKDVIHDVLIKLYEKREHIEITQSLNSYLYKSAYNESLNFIKKNQVRLDHYEEWKVNHNSVYPGFNESVNQSENAVRLRHAINDLPDQCKRIFNLNRFEGYKNQEIADLLGISRRTVETQISKALKILRDTLVTIIVLIIRFL